MNIIRTAAVELTVIPAIAYKQKLSSGGAGIKICRLDKDASAVVTIDKRSGEFTPYGKIDEELFPYEAFSEALEMTVGLPYSSRGKIKINVEEFDKAETGDVEVSPEPEKNKINMIEADEYKAIIDRYSDEKGKLNYQLMNKDFIQFASKSKTVADLIANKASTDDIILFIVKSRAALITNKKESLSDELAAALIETLDEIDPRSAFKELKAHINRLQTKTKRG